MTKACAITSMVIGCLVSLLWLTFIKDKEARALGICQEIFGKHSLLLDKPNWSVVDPIVVALPISIIVAVVVSLITKKPSSEHLDKCFKGSK
jgi:SSS family solute:Na+ symporter